MGGFLALGCGAPDAHQNRNPAQMKITMRSRNRRVVVQVHEVLRAAHGNREDSTDAPTAATLVKAFQCLEAGIQDPRPNRIGQKRLACCRGEKTGRCSILLPDGVPENGASKAEGFGVTSGLVEGRKFSAKQTPEGCPSTRKIAHRQTPGCSSKSRIPPFTVRTEIGPPPPWPSLP
jgi:hypothetical protein